MLEEGGLTCPRLSHAPRCHDCPGAEACETERTAAIARADAELARRRAAGEPVERWGTTAADFAGVVDQDLLAPEAGLEGLGADGLTPVSETGCAQSPRTSPAKVFWFEKPAPGPTLNELGEIDATPLDVTPRPTGYVSPLWPPPGDPHAAHQVVPGTRDCAPHCPCWEARGKPAFLRAEAAPACGACGSTTGAVFYERGPLAGLRRCWPCARPTFTEVHDG